GAGRRCGCGGASSGSSRRSEPLGRLLAGFLADRVLAVHIVRPHLPAGQGLWCNGLMSEIAPSLLAVLLVVYLPPAVVLSWADGREHRLPDRWVGLLTGGVAAALLALSLIQPGLRAEVRVAAVLALVLGFGAVLVALFAPGVLGMGDAKTLPVVV